MKEKLAEILENKKPLKVPDFTGFFKGFMIGATNRI